MKIKRPPAPTPPRVEPQKPADFIARNPVFRVDEFRAVHQAAGRTGQTTAALLRYHVGTGRLKRLRRGLYVTSLEVDPWVLGSRLSRDAVIAYDGALSFHGLAGLGHGLSFLTKERVARFVFNEVVYRPVALPVVLASRPSWGGGLQEVERSGQRLRVTTKERTFVDLLDRVDLSPGPEVLSAAMEEAGNLDFLWMADYARRLGNRLASARLGVLLEGMGGVPPIALLRLEKQRPVSPGYFDRARRRKGDKFLRRWNLVVPRAVLTAIRR